MSKRLGKWLSAALFCIVLLLLAGLVIAAVAAGNLGLVVLGSLWFALVAYFAFLVHETNASP